MIDKILTFSEAVQFYLFIKDYLPDEKDSDILNFLGKIVDNIKNSGKAEIYIQAVSMISGVSEDIILSSTATEVLEVFAEALIRNRFLDLIAFFEKVRL